MVVLWTGISIMCMNVHCRHFGVTDLVLKMPMHSIRLSGNLIFSVPMPMHLVLGTEDSFAIEMPNENKQHRPIITLPLSEMRIIGLNTIDEDLGLLDIA